MYYSTKIMIVIMYRIHHYVSINIEIMMIIKEIDYITIH